MKKITIIIICLICIKIYSQNFSGEIVYKFTIESTDFETNIDSLIKIKRGNMIHYLIRDNFYKLTHLDNGNPVYSLTYNNISKKIYDDYTNKKYITYRDTRTPTYEYYGSEIFEDSTMIIAGLNCFMVKYDSEYAKSTTYYSDKIKVNYESFAEHKVGNWHERLKEVDGCITIKNITEHDGYNEVIEAMEINPKNTETWEFDLPKNKIIVASYSALDKKPKLIGLNNEEIELYRKLVKTASEKLKNNDEYLSILTFVLTKDGGVKYLESVNKNPKELDLAAIDIFKQCDIKFMPGEIDNRKVSSEHFLSIKFTK